MISCNLAAKVASEFYAVPVSLILSATREKQPIHARHVTMWLAHRHGMTPAAIGRAMGRDHTSVLHAISKIEERRESDADLANETRSVEAALVLSMRTLEAIGVTSVEDVDAEAVARRIASHPLNGFRYSTEELRALALYVLSVADQRALENARTEGNPQAVPVTGRFVLTKADGSIEKAAGLVAQAENKLSAVLYTDAERSARAARDRAVQALTQLINSKDLRHAS